MKKFFALALALVLTLAMAVTCFAEATVADSKQVTATYKAGAPAETVYNVTVAFGKMEFTYTAASKGVWNAEDYKYEGGKEAEWTVDEEGGDKITVSNNSNAAVKVTLSYAQAEGFGDVTASFSEASFQLGSADVEFKAVSQTVTMTMGGDLPASATEATKIGTVTVSFEQ